MRADGNCDQGEQDGRAEDAKEEMAVLSGHRFLLSLNEDFPQRHKQVTMRLGTAMLMAYGRLRKTI
jgi:hypothetical protein